MMSPGSGKEAVEGTVKLPDFKTEAQERKFWQKHFIADYWKDLRESDDTFERPRLTPVTVRFDPLVLRKIKMLAKKRGLPYNAYIPYLLARGVEDEISYKPSHDK
jgi:predicted DNA binding CopG/RHH family protein